MSNALYMCEVIASGSKLIPDLLDTLTYQKRQSANNAKDANKN